MFGSPGWLRFTLRYSRIQPVSNRVSIMGRFESASQCRSSQREDDNCHGRPCPLGIREAIDSVGLLLNNDKQPQKLKCVTEELSYGRAGRTGYGCSGKRWECRKVD